MVFSVYSFGEAGLFFFQVVVQGIGYTHISSDVDQLAPYSLEMLNWFWMFAGGDYYFHIFGEELRKPEGNVGLTSSLVISEPIDGFDHNNNFLVDLLWAVDNLLFLNLWGGQIQPICKEFPDIFLKQIYTLF